VRSALSSVTRGVDLRIGISAGVCQGDRTRRLAVSWKWLLILEWVHAIICGVRRASLLPSRPSEAKLPTVDNAFRVSRRDAIRKTATCYVVLNTRTYKRRSGIDGLERRMSSQHSLRGEKYRRPDPARTARIGKILLSFLYGGCWILGQSKNGMAHSHQGSICK
jgi:hypothetical protein